MHPQPGRLGPRTCLPGLPGRLGLRPGEPDRAGRLGLRPDRVGGGLLLGLPAGVGAPLLHQPFLLAGQLDLAAQFVLGDRALPLHRHGPALVGGPVGLLLDTFTRGGAQGAFDLGLGTDRHHAHPDHGEPGRGEPGLRAEPVRHPLPYRGHTVDQGPGERGPGEDVERVLLGRLREQRGELLQRRTAPGAGVRVDGEVQPFGGDGRITDPVRDGRLHGHVLEVGGTGVERHRLLTVVDRYLREGRGEGAVPESDARTVVDESAVPVVPDMGGGGGAQMAPAETPGDVGHEGPLFVSMTLKGSLFLVKLTI